MIDIVVPLYNEEKELAKSVETMIDFLSVTRFPYPYKITLANNESTDGSWRICQELARIYPLVRALDVGGKGKGLAIRTAWSKSDADVLAFMDVDLSSDLSFFKVLIEPVYSGVADIAIGNRLGKSSSIISRKAMRKAASHIYNFAARAILRTSFDDHQCGFKAMRKDKFDIISNSLTERGFFFDTELLAISLRKGFKVVPIDIVWRDSEDSKVALFSDSMKMFLDLLRLRGRLNRKI